MNEIPIETRLRELRLEQERGFGRLARLDREREQLRETLLRIQGAIQVLEEMRRAQPADEADGARAAAVQPHRA